ncbi:MAG TPA: hypothetical protein VJ982_13625 [Gemmatimonadota bacterium]|nr:hypothetical protein [Gemmatimonadota bacterium]
MPIVQLPLRPPPRRLRTVAIVTALVLHVAAVLLIPFPFVSPGDDAVTLLVLTDLEEMPPPVVAPDAAAASEPLAAADLEPDQESSSETGLFGVPRSAPAETAPSGLAGANPFLRRPAETPSTAAAGMSTARAATLPLVVREGGGLGGRRLGRTAEQLAIARAESLLVERLAGIAVVERRETGKVGLANGGITVAIPWGGFLPADRNDEEWRAERCSGGGDGDSDKAGEGEARRAQCD